MSAHEAPRLSILDLLPPAVRDSVAGAAVVLADWAAGPSYVVRHSRSFDPAEPIWVAAGYLERFRGIYRRCVLRLEDGRVLWLDRDAFFRLDDDDRRLRDSGLRVQGLGGGKVIAGMTAVPWALESPLDRSYWVADGRLIAGCYPGDRDPAAARARCERLLYFGVRHVISLMEAEERGHGGEPFVPYLDELLAVSRERHLDASWERHPIRDMGVPTPERMRLILDSIDRAAEAGRPVYAHCWGGRGRTGTVVGCWLARHGMAQGQAVLDMIDELRSRRPDRDKPSPETEEQRDMVRGWRKGE